MQAIVNLVLAVAVVVILLAAWRLRHVCVWPRCANCGRVLWPWQNQCKHRAAHAVCDAAMYAREVRRRVQLGQCSAEKGLALIKARDRNEYQRPLKGGVLRVPRGVVKL